MREFEEGRLQSTRYDSAVAVQPMKPGVRDAVVERSNPVPEPPFIGLRYVQDIDPEALFPLVNTQALFRGRWGYRRGKMSAQEYRQLIDGTVNVITRLMAIIMTTQRMSTFTFLPTTKVAANKPNTAPDAPRLR